MSSISALPVTVLMNSASGRDDAESAWKRIESELAASGRGFRILAPEAPAELAFLARQVASEARLRPGIVAAAGGDGTINTVARELAGTDIPFGVIPLGTFNYFARDLGIPLDAAAATRSMLDGTTRRVHVGRVNDHVFLINSSFGLYRRLQEERERNKRRFGRNKIIAIVSGLVTLLRQHRTYEVSLEVDGRTVRLRTPMILFGMNTLQLEKLDLPVAQCTARGLLAMLVLRPMGRLELLGLALRGALQGLGEAPNLRMHCASRVDVYWRGARKMKVAIDGESTMCALPLRYECMRDALRVIVPRNPEPRE